jgi:ABC-2 type transport system ATP-binding protein
MLGANGAGKTTTIDLVLGFIEPTEGTALINGIDVVKDPLEAKKYVAYVSENVMLYGNFTARQNLDFFTKLGGNKKATKEDYDAAMRRVGLPEESFKRRVKSFSKGMRQRLGIAIAIMKDAKLVLLDEPTSGLDPRGGAEFLELLRGLRAEGKAIFMSTHDIFRAKQIADRLGIMTMGNLATVLEHSEIVQADLEKLYFQYVEAYETEGAEGAAVGAEAAQEVSEETESSS